MEAELERTMNDQINLEFASAYLYLQMSTWCTEAELAGFAHWLRAQYAEELEHALRFVDHVANRDGEVRLQSLDAPRAAFDSLTEVFERALAHEQKVTASISALYALASRSGDYVSLPLLQRFLDEQVEEEATVRQISADLRLAGDDASALLMLDRELQARRASPPASPR